MNNTVDIRARKLEEAGKLLAPVLAEIYLKHGLDLTTTLLMYYAAKGIIMSQDLTTEQKEDKLDEAIIDFNKAVNVLNKSLNG